MSNKKRVPKNRSTKAAAVQPAIPNEFAILEKNVHPCKIPAELKQSSFLECPTEKTVVDCPIKMMKFWRKYVATAAWYREYKECLCVFLLNTRLQLIGFELVSMGTLDTALAHPREVFRQAIIHNAAAIIVGHNHPSGDPDPSEADIKITRDLKRAGELLQIQLADHIIIGDERRKRSSVSLRELGHFYR